MDAVVERAHSLAAYASEKGVGLMVDAEQTYFQPAIRHIVVNILMPTFNVDHEPVVYNTVQCYLKVSGTCSTITSIASPLHALECREQFAV